MICVYINVFMITLPPKTYHVQPNPTFVICEHLHMNIRPRALTCTHGLQCIKPMYCAIHRAFLQSVADTGSPNELQVPRRHPSNRRWAVRHNPTVIAHRCASSRGTHGDTANHSGVPPVILEVRLCVLGGAASDQSDRGGSLGGATHVTASCQCTLAAGAPAVVGWLAAVLWEAFTLERVEFFLPSATNVRTGRANCATGGGCTIAAGCTSGAGSMTLASETCRHYSPVDMDRHPWAVCWHGSVA